MIQLFIHLRERLDSGDRSHIELARLTMCIIGWFNYLTFTHLKYFQRTNLLQATSLKNPRRGKRVLSQTKTQYSKEKKYICTSTEIKLEICCIPSSWDGSTLQSFQFICVVSQCLNYSERASPLWRHFVSIW